MLWALFNDLAQRVITFNKLEQRKMLIRRFRTLRLARGCKALDFGCGTGLFAPTFRQAGLRYYGYDIDQRLVAYARRLYPHDVFISDPADIATYAPFDLIVANCCFHHISDERLFVELERLKPVLADQGLFIMIDLLLDKTDGSILRQQFRKLERGAYVRTANQYRALVARTFRITRSDRERSHVLSFARNPLYNDLVVLECAK
jgi:SAM-dependent methyltransferase